VATSAIIWVVACGSAPVSWFKASIRGHNYVVVVGIGRAIFNRESPDPFIADVQLDGGCRSFPCICGEVKMVVSIRAGRRFCGFWRA